LSLYDYAVGRLFGYALSPESTHRQAGNGFLAIASQSVRIPTDICEGEIKVAGNVEKT
jgi:hypothetical protein